MTEPLKVLYVDDDDDIRTVAVMSLGLDPTMLVHEASSGAAALELLRGGGWRPDVALLDVMMPDMDGPTLLQHIRALPGHAALPVIFMTARARREDLDRYAALGARGVITKPFDPLMLPAEIRSTLAVNGRG
jgi:two-component system, OmpR family, response regulator